MAVVPIIRIKRRNKVVDIFPEGANVRQRMDYFSYTIIHPNIDSGYDRMSSKADKSSAKYVNIVISRTRDHGPCSGVQPSITTRGILGVL